MTTEDAAVVLDRLLRARLPELEAELLSADADLRSLGLDSMGAVQLLLELEPELGIMFPDEAITPETFVSPAAMLRAIRLAQRPSGT